MALTELGYERPVYDEILEQNITRAKELFGEDLDTGELTVMGKLLRLLAANEDEFYQQQEKIYYSAFMSTSEGYSLDRVTALAGISRNPATRAVHEIKIIGESGTIVQAGFLADTDQDIQFYLLEDTVIGGDGTATGRFQAVDAGTTGNVAKGEIRNIVNPETGVDSIEHLSLLAPAEDEESDYDLRKRCLGTRAASGSSTSNAIRAAILSVPNVYGCIIEENDSMETADTGLPPKSFRCYVVCSESQDQLVGEAIFSKKPLGVKSVGEIGVQVTALDGTPHKVFFTRVSEVPVYVKINVKADARFESDGMNQIVNAVSRYINELSNGDDVVLASLYGVIFGIAGVKDVTGLLLSSDGVSYQTGNVLINPAQQAATDTEKIEVVVEQYAG